MHVFKGTKHSPYLKKEKKLRGTSDYDALMKNPFGTKEEEKNVGKDNSNENWKNSTTEMEDEEMETRIEEEADKNEDDEEEEEEENP